MIPVLFVLRGIGHLLSKTHCQVQVGDGRKMRTERARILLNHKDRR